MSTRPKAPQLANAMDQAAAELRRLHKLNLKLTAALVDCADSLQHEIWDSGEDEDGHATLKEWARQVKKARAVIAEARS